jgi:hypothetical protein
MYSGLQIEGVLVYIMPLKHEKRIGDDIGDIKKKILGGENDPLIRFIHLIMQEYDSKCLKMYLITLKVFNIF